MQDATAGKSLAEAREALTKRDFARAVAAFGQAAALEPDDPLLLHGAAVAARGLGDLDAAETRYRAALAAAERRQHFNGTNPAAIATRLVDLYRSRGRFDDAEALCLEVLGSRYASQSGVARSRLHVCLADLYRRQGRFVAAEAAYRIAIAQRRAIFGDRHPKTLQLLPHLAGVCRLLGRHDEADDMCRQTATSFHALEHTRAVGHA